MERQGFGRSFITAFGCAVGYVLVLSNLTSLFFGNYLGGMGDLIFLSWVIPLGVIFFLLVLFGMHQGIKNLNRIAAWFVILTWAILLIFVFTGHFYIAGGLG